jgi:hypothetical protein
MNYDLRIIISCACTDNKHTNNLTLIAPIKFAALFCCVKIKITIKKSMINIVWQNAVSGRRKVSEKREI